MSRIDVEIRGLERLRRKLEEVPQAARELMERATRFAHEEAQRRAKPHAADKGTLAATVKFAIAPGPIPLHARVFTASGIAETVESGRRAGQRPPVASIGRWAASHGIATNPWMLAKEIGQRGTRGVKFMAGAVEATQKRMGDFIRETERAIRQRWGS